jgi:RNA recognition motif-containing protein
MDGTRVYVHNLPWTITEEFLTLHMRAAGAVESVQLMKYSNGRSKGCAIVKYERFEDAANAIATLNDVEVDGRRLLVREDREGPEGAAPGTRPAGVGRAAAAPRAQRAPRAAAVAKSAGGGAGGPENSVFVGNLAWRVTWMMLKDTFLPYGATYADVKMGPDGRSKGWGIVKFSSREFAEAAIQAMNGFNLEGRNIDVHFDRDEA